MGALGNTPRSTTVVTLEARKSYALGLQFLRAADDSKLDLTGCTVRFVVTAPQRKGGAVVLTKTATAVDLPLGLMQLELQAIDLDLAEDEYPFSATLVSANGYSSPLMKGVFDVRANPDPATTGTYAGINPSTSLAVYVEQGDVLQVRVDKVDGLYVVVSTMIAQFQAEQDATNAAHTSEVTALRNQAQTSASEAATSADLAAMEADAAAASAQQANDVVSGNIDTVVGNLVDDLASATGAAVVTRIGSTAPALHTHDDRYYTETEVGDLLDGKAATVHTHPTSDITGLDAALADAQGLFRGRWVTGIDKVRQTIDFASGTAAPGVLSGTGIISNYDTRFGGAITPTPPAKMFEAGYQAGSLSLNVAALGLPLLHKVRFWVSGFENGSDSYSFSRNGTTQQTWSNATMAWNRVEFPISAADTSLVWSYNRYSSGTNNQRILVGRIELLETVAIQPYMTGEFVVHLGKLWESDIDNNGGTPGTAFWTEVPIYDTATAAAVSYAGSTDLSSTTVEAALDELDLEKKPLTRKINALTGTAYTPVLADAGKQLTLTNAAAITLTVPTNATAAFPIGTEIDLAQLGAGQVTVAGAAGVTVSATPGLKISAQYGTARLTKVATDTWLLAGSLAV